MPPAAFQSHKGAISIKQLSEMSSIKTDDIVSTLQALQLIKYWKGQHMIAVSPKVLHDHLESESARKQLQVDVSKLHWQPHSCAPRRPPRASACSFDRIIFTYFLGYPRAQDYSRRACQWCPQVSEAPT